MKIALAVEYDGSAFHGWQSQTHRQTVQDTVQEVLGKIAGHPVRLYGAGRTDAGVHATLMPGHFETDVRRAASAWVRGGNALLPPTVKILWAKQVQQSFHARYSSQRRYYQYLLLNQPIPSALLHGKVAHYPMPLDVDAMRRAARYLRGGHDFSAFRASSCQAQTPLRQLHYLRIRNRGNCFAFYFCGDGFLHHMVRNIMGSLLYVGCHRRPPQWVGDIRKSKNRNLSAPTASAAGLYFNGALYDAAYKLPLCYREAPWGEAVQIGPRGPQRL